MKWIRDGRVFNDGETREVKKFLFFPFTEHEWTRFSVGFERKADVREWRKTTHWLKWVTMIQKYDKHSGEWEDWRIKEDEDEPSA
jgi:hypothetical protein